MLIDCSYFTQGARLVQNATLGTLPNGNAVEVRKYIDSYISDCQLPFLCAMLGDNLAIEVNSYLESIEEDNAAEHIEAIDSVCERLRESFADYVFFQLMKDSNARVTMTGIVLLKSSNTYVSPLRRQVRIWNRMVERNRLFVKWISSGECRLDNIVVSPYMTTRINSLNL